VLVCAAGHRHDVHRRGYLTTARPKGVTGDPRQLLERRAAFLSTGAYEPIANEVARAADDLAAAPRILDSGCGTGYYLARLLSAHPAARALALDVSADAVARTVTATGAAGIVASVWGALPIRSGAADLILCVFAPRNGAEFARILSPAGRLIVVTPQPDHLGELRESGAAIGIHPHKLQHLDESVRPLVLRDRSTLRYEIELDEQGAALLVGMGPSGHRSDLAVPRAGTVTVAVDVSVYRAAASDSGLQAARDSAPTQSGR
jgi:23S rRNA (guanine745-N1)-methyltransferase